MDNPRTLPPLVRGKVMGVLNFFIDEIVMHKDELYLTENLDVTAQVLWWGEILPAFIRPKILHLQGKILSNSESTKASYSVQYEIKTSVDLFKSYLKACEVIELSVYDGVENYVIGSAFLKNLSILLNRNNEFISMPIIDHSGEEIGQMKIHINFFEYPQDNLNYISVSKIGVKNLDTSEEEASDIVKRNYIFTAEKTRFYDDSSKISNLEVESDQNSEFDRHSMKDKNRISDLVLFNSESKFKKIGPLKKPFTNQAKESSKCINFPRVSVSRCSSEILNFDSGLKIKEPKKSNKSKSPNKFSLNSVESKSKPKAGKSNLKILAVKEKFPNKTTSRNLLFKNPKVAVTNQMDYTTIKSSKSFDYKNSELESFPQTCTNKIVFDYLLGATMTKENEENAMENFKKMSPSQDIVSSINELCLTSDETKICKNKSIKHNLSFDLTNPIERTYYEKFFVKNNLIEFEIAELLNEPENSCAVQQWKTSGKNNLKENFKMQNDSVNETVAKKCDNFALDNVSKMNKNANNCARCKYYKKLEDLDTIIESLKHFEKNILKQEKRLQLDFEDNLSKQVYKVSGS